jgi:glycosyltransferase involved in cell wall biosynthesis
MGQLSNAEVICAVATSDVYVVASENVIFDLATLEAMASGVPVVVTRDGREPRVQIRW